MDKTKAIEVLENELISLRYDGNISDELEDAFETAINTLKEKKDMEVYSADDKAIAIETIKNLVEKYGFTLTDIGMEVHPDTEIMHVAERLANNEITPEQLGIKPKVVTETEKDTKLLCELYNYIRDNVEEGDYEYIREYISEEYWDDLNIRPKKKYKVVEVKLEKKIYNTLQVVIPDDEDESNVDDYFDTYDVDSDYPDDEDDWEIAETRSVLDGVTKKEIGYTYNSDDIWNYDDIDDLD